MAYTREQIQSIFRSSFNQPEWTNMIINFFKAREVYRVNNPLDINPEEGRGSLLGYLDTQDGYRIGFFYLKLNRSIDRRKVGLRQMITQYIKIDSDAGIGVFDDGNHWRLSFITDLNGEKTAPKRYTFVFGDSENQYRTAVDRFMDLQKNGISFKNIKEAFSVEALTKQFYNDLFDWYTWALKEDTGVYFPNNPNTPEDDREHLDTKMIRLITRLMFVWFIKQKKLVPDALFNPEEVSLWLKDFDPQSMDSANYYHAILQNLFFATLNRPIKTITTDKDGNEVVEPRKFAESSSQDVKSLYRHKDLFQLNEEKILEIFAFIPFINGGLFECLDKNKTSDGVEHAYYDDGFSRNNTKDKKTGRWTHRAFIPNKLFFDPKDGIISIFNRYNFTVEENSPSEQQVALDPELLGKVFENLLGVYNPETHDTARNQSGSFYTPREIVNYMVDISLQAYLGNTDNVKAVFAEDFVYDESQKAFYDSIIEKLQTIKVLDPACGSGAFPIGMLNRIVEIMERLKATGNKYDMKLQIMENCIYGGDIQTIAAQITKLRFFISLVCDCQKTDNPDDNYGIPNLPNLETHFVTCDSLIGLKKSRQLNFYETDIVALKEKLKEVRHEHFTAKSFSVKRRLRNRDKQLRDELSRMLQDDSVVDSIDAKQMAGWNPYDQNAKSSFFDPEWMFGIKDGFDVVIGNPPYISTKGVKETDKKRYEAQYGFSDDTYNLFALRALGCTYRKDKKNIFTINSLVAKNGTLIYIIPKTFWTTQTKRFMRDVILGKQVNVIFDTANPFEAVMVDTCIIQVQNAPYNPNHEISILDGHDNLFDPIVFEPVRQSLYINTQNSVIFKPSPENLKTYNKYGTIVKRLFDTWWDRICTSRDIEKNILYLQKYRKSLKEGDVALLGCVTDGGQGLATANNGRFVAVRMCTKWANNIKASRPIKLAEAIKKHHIPLDKINGLTPKEFLETSTEHEIAEKFDELKNKYGRDIFGQGYIYRLIEDSEIVSADDLTDNEKEKGINPSKKHYVMYDKGDKDGNRWYLDTPFAIDWSEGNVTFLKSNSGKKGQGMPVVRNPKFYFKEGFCWSDIHTTLLRCRLKGKSVHDVKSMSLFSMTDAIPEYYIISILNSTFMSYYVESFVNNTQTFQINDARMVPIVVPSEEQLSHIKEIYDNSISLKKKQFQTKNEAKIAEFESQLNEWQEKLDDYVLGIYGLK